MLNACEATPGCIGYNGISYLSKALAGNLGYASLKNNAGDYTLPTAPAIKAAVASFVPLTPPNETISMIDGPAAAGYPIVNYEYAVVKSVSRTPPRPARSRPSCTGSSPRATARPT